MTIKEALEWADEANIDDTLYHAKHINLVVKELSRAYRELLADRDKLRSVIKNRDKCDFCDMFEIFPNEPDTRCEEGEAMDEALAQSEAMGK
jgi:hypothetical protein